MADKCYICGDKSSNWENKFSISLSIIAIVLSIAALAGVKERWSQMQLEERLQIYVEELDALSKRREAKILSESEQEKYQKNCLEGFGVKSEWCQSMDEKLNSSSENYNQNLRLVISSARFLSRHQELISVNAEITSIDSICGHLDELEDLHEIYKMYSTKNSNIPNIDWQSIRPTMCDFRIYIKSTQ
jgi:hypothetical protein